MNDEIGWVLSFEHNESFLVKFRKISNSLFPDIILISIKLSNVHYGYILILCWHLDRSHTHIHTSTLSNQYDIELTRKNKRYFL